MKRLWIAAALLLAILGGCLCNAWYLGSLTREMNQLLEQAGQLAQTDSWPEARRLTSQAGQRGPAGPAARRTPHRPPGTDQILRAFQAVFQYLDLEEMDQYAAANADLMTLMALLAEMEQPSFVNVF